MIFVGFARWPESAILQPTRGDDWTRVLGWPGYKAYRHEIDEPSKRLRLWVPRKRANRLLVCSGWGKPTGEVVASYERDVRDLPCFECPTAVVIELHGVRCSDGGVKAEKVPLLPGKSPFSKHLGRLKACCRQPAT